MPSHQTRRRAKSLSRGRNLSHGKSLRKSQRRAASLERLKEINSKKIGEGGFGVVSRPPAECAPELNNNNSKSVLAYRREAKKKYVGNPNYISKLSEYDQAIKELRLGRLVKEYIKDWKNYYCFTEFYCAAPDDKHIRVGIDDYQDTYGIAPYCGVPLDSIIKEKTYISPIESCCLMEALKQLAIGLGKLHNLEIYHQDIHDGNVLYNPKDKKLRWIDFGLAEDLYEIKQEAGNNHKNNRILVHAKVEDTEGLIFSIIKPTLEFIRYKLSQGSKTNKSERCFDDTVYYLSLMPQKMDEIYLPNRYDYPDKYFTEINKLKDKYIKFVNLFIGDYEVTDRCVWTAKNSSKK
jgi:serine/threonine protein kinase